MGEIKIQELWVKLLNIRNFLFNECQDDLQFTDDEWDLIRDIFTLSK